MWLISRARSTAGTAIVNIVAAVADTPGAIGSRSQAQADRFAPQFGIARAHLSHEALAADADDIIDVATPHPLHFANAKTAPAANKHVLVERRFTLNATEADEIVAIAEAKSLIVLEAIWTRFLPDRSGYAN
jgi:predicted dehydrogenase